MLKRKEGLQGQELESNYPDPAVSLHQGYCSIAVLGFLGLMICPFSLTTGSSSKERRKVAYAEVEMCPIYVYIYRERELFMKPEGLDDVGKEEFVKRHMSSLCGQVSYPLDHYTVTQRHTYNVTEGKALVSWTGC